MAKEFEPDTHSDILHQHALDAISNKDGDTASNIINHPNTAPETLKSLYEHGVSKENTAIGSDDFTKMFEHPNFPAAQAENFITHPDFANYEDYKYQHTAASKVPGVNKKVLEQTVQSDIENPKVVPGQHRKYKNLSPAFYESMLASRKTPQQPSNVEAASSNNRSAKIDSIAINGLTKTNQHTSQSLDLTVKKLLEGLPENFNSSVSAYNADRYGTTPTSKHEHKQALEDLVVNQPLLNKNHLNDIYAKSQSISDPYDYRYNDTASKILSHENVDPTLLSSAAVDKNLNSHNRQTAIQNKRLPDETRKSLVKNAIKEINDGKRYDSNIERLLSNPSITPEEVNQLAETGDHKALAHEHTHSDIIADQWGKSTKDLNAGRNFVSYRNTPPQVLKELVNHKNQEVAVDALKHKNSDINVVNEGLKRKAITVQEAARKHPLVANQEVLKGLQEGKVRGSSLVVDPDIRKTFDSFDEPTRKQIISQMHEKYKGQFSEEAKKKTKEDAPQFWATKSWLATHQDAPVSIQKSNKQDILDYHSDNCPSDAIESHTSNEDKNRSSKLVRQLLEKRDPAAENYVLSRPGSVAQYAAYGGRDTENLSSDFINELYSKTKELHSQNTTIFDDNGHTLSYMEKARNHLAKHNNVPENVFEDIALNPEYQADRSSWENRQFSGGNKNTVYDSFLSKKPEEYRNGFYQKMLNQNSPHANAAIVSSTTSPENIRDEAFSRMSPEELMKWNTKSNLPLIKHLTPTKLQEALHGHLNHYSLPNDQNAGKGFQKEIVSSLDPKSAEHRQIVKDFLIKNSELDPSDSRKLSTEDLVDKLPVGHMYDHGDLWGTLNKVGANDPTAAAALAIRSGIETDSPSPEANKTIFDRLAQAVSVNSNPEDDHFGHALKSVLEMAGKENSSIAKDLKKMAGNQKDGLDFLADVQGPNAKAIRQLAGSLNLISQSKANELAASGTQSFAETLNSFPPTQRNIMIHDSLESGDYQNTSKEDADAILEHADLSDFKHKGKINEGVVKLFDLAEKHGSQKIDEVLSQFSQKVKSGYRGRTKSVLGKGVAQEALKHLIKHVDSTRTDALSNNKSMFTIYDNLKNTDLVGPQMLSKIAKNAVALKDFDTLIGLSNDSNAPESITLTLVRAASVPDQLNVGQVAKISQMTSKANFGADGVKKLTNAFNTKIAAEPEGPNKDQYKKDFINNIYKGIGSGNQEKSDVITDTIKQHAFGPDEKAAKVARSKLTKLFGRSPVSEDEQIRLFQTLPTDTKAYDEPISSSLLGKNMLNHPSVIESATEGWKLNAVIDESENLSKANFSILSDRVLNSQAPEVQNKKSYLLNSAVSSVRVNPQDVTKIARSLSDNEAGTFIDAFTKHRDVTAINTNIDKMLESRTNRLDELMNMQTSTAVGGQKFDHEHINSMVYNANRASQIVSSLGIGEDVPRLQEKLETVNKFIDKIHELSGKIHTAHIQQLNSGKEVDHREISVNTGHMVDTLGNILTSGLSYSKEHSLKLLDIIRHLTESDKAHADKGIKLTTNFDTLSKSISKWTQKAEGLNSEDWKHVIKNLPEIQFTMSNRNVISSHHLDHVDVHAMASLDSGRTLAHIGDWFEKMDSGAIDTHGKKLVDHLVNISKSYEKHNYSESIKQALQAAPHIFDSDLVQKVANVESDKAKQNEIFKEAVRHGAGGEKTSDAFLADIGSQIETEISSMDPDKQDRYSQGIAKHLEPILDSSKISENSGHKILDMFNKHPAAMMDSFERLANNKALPETVASSLTKTFIDRLSSDTKFKDSSTAKQLATKLSQNPKVSFSDFEKLYKISDSPQYSNVIESGKKFHPALANPKYGGKLFRSREMVIPESLENIDKSKLATKASAPVGNQLKTKQRLTEAMSQIPAEGIAWAEAKKQFPKFEQLSEIKKIFMDKKNKPVIPEDFAHALKELEDKKQENEFHVTYASWKGGQRHTGNTNMVVQLNNSEKTEAALSQDPALWSLYQFLLRQANKIVGETVGSHPTSPQTVSWSRVDTSQGKKGWVIEEFQSDFAQKFRKNLRGLLSNTPSGLNIEGHFINSAKLAEYARKIDKAVEGHHKAGLEAIKQSATMHGVSKIFMHGTSVRANLSGGDNNGRYNKDYVNENIKRIYGEEPKANGFSECDYSDYPNFDKKLLDTTKKEFEDTKCWVMDLKKKA